jgi:fatty acid desaturase
MLRFSADRRTLFLLTCFGALSATAWVLDLHGVAGALACVVLCISSWICAIIAHNTVHSPVFKKRWMNRWFQVWLSLSYGFPVSEYVPGHNLSHHKFTQHAEDVMRTSKVNYRWNLMNFLLFFFHVGPGVTAGNYVYKQAMKQRLPQWNRQLMYEIVAVWGVKAVLLLLDWRRALLFYIVPHLFAVWGITTVNFLQHDGTDQEHPVNHSRNFVGRVFNWFTLNNGYHGIHHDHPGLHWSLLPAAHAEKFHPTIDPRLEAPSLALYMFGAFIFPGKRVMYDGRPVVVTPLPDEDWVAASRSTALEDLGAMGSTDALA